MSKMLRQTVDRIIAMPEAAGMVVDVESGRKHWRIVGRLGEQRRQLCVLSFGGGKAKDFDTPGRSGLNLMRGIRQKLNEMRETAT